MDDKLKEVLRKVELLCEQNPEFAAALRNKLGVTVASSPVPVQDERIGKIEEYLGLDRKLDDIDNPTEIYKSIDYSFISDEVLHEHLVSDFREMMRYRYGCRSHKKDFYEFCKFAHFQLEALVNDYIELWSLDENQCFSAEKAIKNIQNNWPNTLDQKPTFREKIQSASDIDYFQKITAILKHLQDNQTETKLISRIPYSSIYYPGQKVYIPYYLNDVISYIRKVRNDFSHRGPIAQHIEDDIETYENKKHIENTPYGLQYKFSKYDGDIKYYMWRKSTPWNDVIEALSFILEADRKLYE